MSTPTEITLHYSRDSKTKVTYYTVAIPDSRMEGMSGANLKGIIPQLWVSTRTKPERVSLLARAVAQIEAYLPLGGPPPVDIKPRLVERLARFLVGLCFWRSRK